MHIKFNSLNQHEPLVISLCNPGSGYDNNTKAPTRILGVLSNISDDELVLNFNTTSELNFRVHKTKGRSDSDLSDSSELELALKLFDDIQNRRLLFVKDIGYFVIDDVTYGYDTSGEYKDIKSSSVESELRGKKIPFIKDDTYSFRSLLSQIVPIQNDTAEDSDNSLIWKVDKDIPGTLLSKYRTFEDVDVDSDRLSFLIENMQEAYECIFEFDIIYRIVHVYDQADYVQPTNIHLTRKDLINSISVVENSDDLYTALSVLGSDNETISSINPLGGNVIYDFTYYLPWMSKSLREKVIAWQKLVKECEQEYYAASLGYFKISDVVSDYDMELERLKSLEETYAKCMISKTDPWLKQLNQALVSAGNSLASGFEKLKKKIDDLSNDPNNKPNIENSLSREYKSGDKMGYDCSNYGKFLNGIDEKYLNPPKKDEIIKKAADFIIDGTILIGADLFTDGDVASLEFDAGIKRNKVLKDIAKAEAERKPYEILMNKRKQEMDDIRKKVSMAEYFGDDMDELNFFIFEGNYKDDYVIITDQMSQKEIFEQLQTMLGRARLTLSKASHPTQEFTVDVENFIFEKEFKPWSDQLETGRAVNIEIEDGDTAQLFLTGITANYQDKSLSLTFGNRLDRFDAKSVFEKVLGGVSRSSNSINFIKDTMYPLKNGEFDRVKKAIEDARNLSLGDAFSAKDEEVVIDGSGYLGRKKLSDGTFDPKQIKITGKNILFTDDSWDTCATAIGEIFTDTSQNKTSYGVNARYLIGEAIFGQNLTIRNNDSSVKIDNNGITINCVENITPFKILKTNNDNTTKDLLWVDDKGNLNFSGNLSGASGSFNGKVTATEIYATKGTIGGVIIHDGYITTKEGSKFRGSGLWVGTEDGSTAINGTTVKSGWQLTIGDILGVSAAGTLCAKDAVISGRITATSLTLDGCQIPYNKISNPPDLTVYISKDGKIGTGEFSEKTSSSTAFKVSSEGLLQAKNAIIYGTIYASKGKFGGTLDAAKGSFSGNLSAAGGSFAGDISAATGTFSGGIQATKGSIGGFTIGEKSLSNDQSADTLGGIVLSTSSQYKLNCSLTGLMENKSIGDVYCSIVGTRFVPSGISSTGIYVNVAYIAKAHVNQLWVMNTPSSTENANTYIANNGGVSKTAASSRRYKTRISNLLSETLNPHGLYKVPVVEYVYKEGYLSESDLNYKKKVVGLIAEDVKKYYPIGATYNADGTVENWNERFIIPGMLKLIQEQHEQITELQSQVSDLIEKSA